MEYNIDRIIVVDLCGAMAHFRAFYTNSSSLSYSFPPRTVITGILAGIMGRQRDSYYDEFSRESCKIALSICSPFRRMMNTLNYSYMKSPKDFVINKGQHLQVQFETVIPDARPFVWGELVYRIYIWHSRPEVLDEIRRRAQQKRYVYPPFMGISEYTAELEFVDEFTSGDIQVVSAEDPVEFSTVLNADLIPDRGLEFRNGDQPLQYMKEVMPLEFKSDRSNKSTGKFIFEKNLHSIRAKISVPFIRARGENIAFMEADHVTS